MIYDCFIFNSELDLLELRLEFLSPYVDTFVLVESAQTLSGHPKPLHYEQNKDRFAKFAHQIKHIICPNKETDSAWHYEYFQRDYIRTALQNCNDEDTILISDVDEIVNLPLILKNFNVNKPFLVELPIYYYFFNLKGDVKFRSNLLAPYKDLKNNDLGNRDQYRLITEEIISCSDFNTGWHFSYLFGKDLSRYQEKLKSFSHQEYNNSYFLDPRRIQICIELGIDLFERKFLKYSFANPKKILSNELLAIIERNKSLSKYVGKSISFSKIFANTQYLTYYCKFKIIPFMNHHLKFNILIGKIIKSK